MIYCKNYQPKWTNRLLTGSVWLIRGLIEAIEWGATEKRLCLCHRWCQSSWGGQGSEEEMADICAGHLGWSEAIVWEIYSNKRRCEQKHMLIYPACSITPCLNSEDCLLGGVSMQLIELKGTWKSVGVHLRSLLLTIPPCSCTQPKHIWIHLHADIGTWNLTKNQECSQFHWPWTVLVLQWFIFAFIW